MAMAITMRMVARFFSPRLEDNFKNIYKNAKNKNKKQRKQHGS
jgi:hypothetical protein